jgi:hypothetical protein
VIKFTSIKPEQRRAFHNVLTMSLMGHLGHSAMSASGPHRR